MILEIGKLYKLKCDGTAFFRDPDGAVIRKNAGDVILYIDRNRFLDVQNTVKMSPSSMLLKDPTSYLYLLV